MSPNQLEDVVLLDVLVLLVTSPVWLSQLLWRIAAGAYNDWREACP